MEENIRIWGLTPEQVHLLMDFYAIHTGKNPQDIDSLTGFRGHRESWEEIERLVRLGLRAKQLESMLAVAEGALRFYGNEDVWSGHWENWCKPDPEKHDWVSPEIDGDDGETARTALAEIERMRKDGGATP